MLNRLVRLRRLKDYGHISFNADHIQIVFSINTGLLTGICALCSLISYFASPNTFVYIGFFFCIGRRKTSVSHTAHYSYD